jgi:Holliday junction resolvase
MVMPINSRTKGSATEREFSKRIEKNLGIKLIRNLEQTRGGGHDLIPEHSAVGPLADQFRKLAIECKRYAKVMRADLERFWVQTTEQAGKIEGVPVLAYRANFEDWKVVVPVGYVNGGLQLCDFWLTPLEDTVTIGPELFTDIVLVNVLS